jgi:glycosyltransferase involved in cell wall biosynthesis
MMNILLESRAFHPSVGGIEMMSHELALDWQKRGHSVTIVTQSSLGNADELTDIHVERTPHLRRMWGIMSQADIFVQNGISLRSAPLAILTGTPRVFVHQTIIEPDSSTHPLRMKLKQWLTRYGYNIAISEPALRPVQGPVTRIPNTFRPQFDRFEMNERWDRRSGLLFVGRLVSVKGADVALSALRRLHDSGLEETLTICGDGPERPELESEAERLGIRDFVRFSGWTSPDDLADLYSTSKATLVPSRYEPFGIVAIESIACGCPVVASNIDGLPEAVGDCGLLVEPEHPEKLSRAIRRALQTEVRTELRNSMPKHIERHRIDRIGDRYLNVMEEAINSSQLTVLA